MFLIIGLGNPGKRYEKTYHNLGFLTLDKLCEKFGGKWTNKYCDAKICETEFKGEKIVLAKPQTFMNLSGESISKLIKKFKLNLKDLLVIFDDVDIKKGEFRYRQNGSGGSHNGMKNIVEKLKTTDFARIRIGIKEENINDLADYVLSEITESFDEVLSNVVKFVFEEILAKRKN